MCDRLTIKCAGQEYEKMWIGTSNEEAIKILSYRMSLTTGDIIELTNGTKAVVACNGHNENMLICFKPVFGDKYEKGLHKFSAPYNVVKHPVYGEAVDFEDVIRVEGPGMLRNLINDKRWKEAAELFDDLRFISVDVSEFSGDLADIHAGCKEEEKELETTLRSLLEKVEGGIN